jgi:hypothetical protein
MPVHEPEAGDIVEITASRRDFAMIGKIFRITEPIYGTFSVQRKFLAEYRQITVDRT